MKCTKCVEKAIINMRQHKLALCKDHFLEWIPNQVQRFIQKYHMFCDQDRILVAVSGGKDSLSLWDILFRLGYKVDGLYIGLGIDVRIGYSAESQRLTKAFAAERNLPLHIVDIAEVYGETIPAIARRTQRGKQKPCAVCGLIKRHVMNRIAYDLNYSVLVTGHNLDDETATLLGNSLNWLAEYLVRQMPVLDAHQSGLIRKAKPLCRIYERDIAAYAFIRGIEYVHDECPHAKGSTSFLYKGLMNKLEFKKPGSKTNFYVSFLQAKEKGLFAPQADPNNNRLRLCSSCGLPTSSPNKCSFCSLFDKS